MRRIIKLYRSAFSGLPRDVWILALVALVNRSGTMVLPFIVLYLTLNEGFTTTQAGQVLSIYGLGAIIGSYLGGWLADRIGSDRCQRLSLVASGVGFLVVAAIDGLVSISIAMFGLAVVGEAFRPANMAATIERVPAELHARAFALLRMAINLGMGLGPAIGGFLALYDYTWLFVIDAATCWAAAAVLTHYLSPKRLDAPAAGRPRPPRGRSPWLDLPFLAFLLLVFALANVFFQLMSTVPLTFRDLYGFRENVIGAMLAINALIIVLVEMVLIHWAQRHDRMLLIGIGSALVCVGFGLQPFGSSVPFAALTIVIWTVGEMLSLPLMNVVVAERADASNRGRYMGVYTMVFSVAFVSAPAAGTWIYERFGAEVLWVGVGLLALPIALGALLLGRTLSLRPRVAGV